MSDYNQQTLLSDVISDTMGNSIYKQDLVTFFRNTDVKLKDILDLNFLSYIIENMKISNINSDIIVEFVIYYNNVLIRVPYSGRGTHSDEAVGHIEKNKNSMYVESLFKNIMNNIKGHLIGDRFMEIKGVESYFAPLSDNDDNVTSYNVLRTISNLKEEKRNAVQSFEINYTNLIQDDFDGLLPLVELLPNLKMIRFMGQRWKYLGINTYSTISSYLENLDYLNICHCPLASSDSRELFTQLTYEQFTKLIFIPEVWLKAEKWTTLLRDRDDQDLVKDIINNTHREFYEGKIVYYSNQEDKIYRSKLSLSNNYHISYKDWRDTVYCVMYNTLDNVIEFIPYDTNGDVILYNIIDVTDEISESDLWIPSNRINKKIEGFNIEEHVYHFEVYE